MHRMTYSLNPPVSSSLSVQDSPLLVNTQSPKIFRKHVEFFARCFMRELHFDFVQFDASELSSSRFYTPYDAYLFHERAWDLVRHVDEPARSRTIGACCFRRDTAIGSESGWTLQWVWFHPFFRQRGHLSTAWPTFKERYGEFTVDPPLSLAMKAFLAKQECLEGVTASSQGVG